MTHKVHTCSPATLYAVLCIRVAVHKMRAVFDVQHCLLVCAQGLSQHVIECLSEGRITCKQLNLSLDVWIPPQQRPHALTTLLAQLHDVDTGPDTLVMLKGLKWTHETAQILATALPTLPHLRVGVDFFDSLTDELLAVAKHMGPHVRRLSVPGVLLSADYNHEPWPWPGAELYSASLRLSEAVKLPRIDGATPGSVECGYLGVDDEVAREVSCWHCACT